MIVFQRRQAKYLVGDYLTFGFTSLGNAPISLGFEHIYRLSGTKTDTYSLSGTKQLTYSLEGTGGADYSLSGTV